MSWSTSLLRMKPPCVVKPLHLCSPKATRSRKRRRDSCFHNLNGYIEAFEDTWHWTDEAEKSFDEMMTSGNTDAAEMLRAMRSFLKENDMMAYVAMMAVRLLELHRVLKPTGSLCTAIRQRVTI